MFELTRDQQRQKTGCQTDFFFAFFFFDDKLGDFLLSAIIVRNIISLAVEER